MTQAINFHPSHRAILLAYHIAETCLVRGDIAQMISVAMPIGEGGAFLWHRAQELERVGALRFLHVKGRRVLTAYGRQVAQAVIAELDHKVERKLDPIEYQCESDNRSRLLELLQSMNTVCVPEFTAWSFARDQYFAAHAKPEVGHVAHS